MEHLACFIDHTLLKPDATADDIKALCAEAMKHSFYSVCVNSSRIALAYAELGDSEVRVASVVGFPLGAMDADAKRYETEMAVDTGASEIDVVMNVGKFKDGDDRFVFRELRDVVEAADDRIVKVILETCLLAPEEIVRACHLVVESGAKFVKTSTGFSSGGATLDIVKLMRVTVGEKFGVKASGGIRDRATAEAMIAAGATRLGTSAGVAIMNAETSESEY
jgi:deoxyribose-phosphate aldolase